MAKPSSTQIRQREQTRRYRATESKTNQPSRKASRFLPQDDKDSIHDGSRKWWRAGIFPWMFFWMYRISLEWLVSPWNGEYLLGMVLENQRVHYLHAV